MISLYDAHNHLQDERLSAHLDEIVRDLPTLGVQACVVNGASEKDWPAVAALAKRFSWVIPAFGLHPWLTKERSTNWFDALRRLMDEHPRACVGEIGLDRWIRDADIADQEKVFIAQLELAGERSVAASIHCLKAWGHLEDVLAAHRPSVRGFLIHSYGGSAEMVPKFAKLGGFFSVSGYFGHERKASQRDVFKKIPIERLLVETDAPDMLPPRELISHDLGELNDPRNLPRVYEFAAMLRNMPPLAFAMQIEANFKSLFL